MVQVGSYSVIATRF